MDKIIEYNVAYILTEFNTPSRIAKKEISIELSQNGRSFTPYGAFELAKQLIKWSASVDNDIARIIKSPIKEW